jgi:hypothetical protein
MHRALVLGATALMLLTAGCQTNSRDQLLKADASAVQLRSIQTRAFDMTDREQTIRTVIATLQDLGFVVDKADAELGSVSGTKLTCYQLRMTVNVRPRSQSETLVRANVQYKLTAVEDPQPCQQFFDALQQAMFLTSHEVD